MRDHLLPIQSGSLFCKDFASRWSHFDIHRLERFSNWQQAKVAIAKCIHYKRVLKSRISNDTGTRPNAETNVEKLGEAEREIFKAVQIHSFTEEVELLTRSTHIVNELRRFALAFIHSHSGATGVFRNAFMRKVAEATSCLPKTLQTT